MNGFRQKKGIDFEEIFLPVVKMSSIRVVLGLATSLNLEIKQLDVKTAFLHGDLEEEIYMKQSEDFEVKGNEHLVCRLRKSLYGLKQAPRQWYMKFESFMEEQEYGKEHWIVVKWILRYLRGTFTLCLCYGNVKPELSGYSDADYAGDVDSRKFTSGFIIIFARGAISWQLRLQKCIALFTTEVEYIAITKGGKELLWMQKFLQELGLKQEKLFYIAIA